MADGEHLVDNGVNVEALIAAREALTNAPRPPSSSGGPPANGRMARTAIRRSKAFTASAQEQQRKTDVHLRRRSSGGLRLRGQRRHAGRVCPGGTGKLSDRRYRRGRPESQHPAPLGDGDHRRGHGHPWHPRHRQDVRNGFEGIKVTYKIDADAKREDIEALVAQSQKRSAVYDIVTNPTNVTVVVN